MQCARESKVMHTSVVESHHLLGEPSTSYLRQAGWRPSLVHAIKHATVAFWPLLIVCT